MGINGKRPGLSLIVLLCYCRHCLNQTKNTSTHYGHFQNSQNLQLSQNSRLDHVATLHCMVGERSIFSCSTGI